jgi:hypothetical protein
MGVIYVIECKETGEKYVGSTKQPLDIRMTGHRYNCKAYDDGKNMTNCSSFNIIRRNNYEVKVLEELETNDKKELTKIETKYINELDSINIMKKAYASPEEKKQLRKEYDQTAEHKQKKSQWDKKYREKNKEKVDEKKKEWRDNNKEKVAEQKKIYYEKNKEKVAEQKKKWYEKSKENGKKDIIICSCGGTFSLNNKKRHEQTKKHLDSI